MVSFLFRGLTLAPYYGVLVRRSIRDVLKALAGREPSIVHTLHYGANYLDPKHLSIWYLVRTSGDLEQARRNGLEQEIARSTRDALARHGYPEAALSQIHVGVESEENVEKGGGWQRYFR